MSHPPQQHNSNSNNLTTLCTIGVAASIGAFALYRFAPVVTMFHRRKQMRTDIHRKLAIREEQRRQLRKLLESNPYFAQSMEERRTIVEMDAHEIVQAIKAGKYSAETVMLCFCERALVAGEQLNSNAEEFFLDAIARAREADHELKARGPDGVGSLHGLPVSIKDNINLEGLDSTCGTAARLFHPKSASSVLVQALTQEGAIPFVKSNIPQSMMIPESTNAVFGRALNPWNKARSPGGSSGGEAALVASRASPLGIGTDIGGSVRIPCHFCGLAGFKATPDRVSRSGVTAPRLKNQSGQTNIQSVAGPLARCVDDLVLVMKAWWGPRSPMFVVDPFVPPIVFDDAAYAQHKVVKGVTTSSLRIGYFEHDGNFATSTACARAVQQVKDKLEALGHVLVPFTVPNPEEYVKIYSEILTSDGNMRSQVDGLLGERILDEYKEMKFVADIPRPLRKVVAKFLGLIGDHRMARLLVATGKKSTYEYWGLIKRLSAYRSRFTLEMQKADIDVLLCPGGVMPAVPHGMSTKLLTSFCLTFLFNLLHYPAGTVPVTVVREEECEYRDPTNPDRWTKGIHECMKGAKGLPVGVQVAGLPYKDELCLRVMKEIEGAVKFDHNVDPFKFV